MGETDILKDNNDNSKQKVVFIKPRNIFWQQNICRMNCGDYRGVSCLFFICFLRTAKFIRIDMH